jgi:hypothetical protein
MNTERQGTFMDSFLIIVLEALKAVSGSVTLLPELIGLSDV